MTDNERDHATRMMAMLRGFGWEFGLAVSEAGRLSLTMRIGSQPEDPADRAAFWDALTALAPAAEALLLEERADITSGTLH